MSWSISISNVSRADAVAAIDAAKPGGQDDLAQERDEQVYDAKRVALALVDGNGLVGDIETDAFNVALYGHANPGHKDQAGFVTDTITVTVTRVPTPRQAAQPTDAGGDTPST
jgi:hypothetical protein